MSDTSEMAGRRRFELVARTFASSDGWQLNVLA